MIMYKNVNNPFGGESDVVHRIIDNSFIPFDLANTDYQKYLQWLSEGGVPLPADEVTE